MQTQALCYDGECGRCTSITSCPTCKSRFSTCWRIPPTCPAVMCLTSPTSSLQFFQVLLCPKTNTIAFIETKLLRFVTFLVVHLRASFDGIVKVLSDMFFCPVKPQQQPIVGGCMDDVEVNRNLGKVSYVKSCGLSGSLSTNSHNITPRQLVALESLLRRRHLQMYARVHEWTECISKRSIAFDGEVVVFSISLLLMCKLGTGVSMHPSRSPDFAVSSFRCTGAVVPRQPQFNSKVRSAYL